MKKLTREQMKDVMGGAHTSVGAGTNPCSTGKCGPELAYNCSIEYETAEENSPATCCCGHGSYNADCEG